jgi:hypothetical protein
MVKRIVINETSDRLKHGFYSMEADKPVCLRIGTDW